MRDAAAGGLAQRAGRPRTEAGQAVSARRRRRLTDPAEETDGQQYRPAGSGAVRHDGGLRIAPVMREPSGPYDDTEHQHAAAETDAAPRVANRARKDEISGALTT
jgi:hypothetical protein